MTARLRLADDAYELLQSQQGAWTPLAMLRPGAGALIDVTRAASEAGLERAIQRAEDWLMPHAPGLQGEWLEVEDLAHRLRSGMQEALGATETEWTVDGFERLFLRLVDLATGRSVPGWLAAHPAFIADVLLVRELAHHGRVRGIRLL